MATACVIFVEGDNDRSFVERLLNHLQLPNFEMEIIGGGVSKLEISRPTIMRHHAEGKRVAIILDADTDIDDRRAQFIAEKIRLGIPADHLFFVPDNIRPGCLETLLEEIAVTRHRGLYECFSQYEECVRGLSDEYQLPGRKARVYAFCEAVGDGPRERDRDYGNANYWNLDAASLNPLKGFLRACARLPTDSDTPEEEK